MQTTDKDNIQLSNLPLAVGAQSSGTSENTQNSKKEEEILKLTHQYCASKNIDKLLTHLFHVLNTLLSQEESVDSKKCDESEKIRKKIAKILTENKTTINEEKDDKGKTALMLAAYKGHNFTVKLLLENNIIENIDKKNNDEQTALMLAVLNGKGDCVASLLENKADANATNKNGQTVLTQAISKGVVGIIETLLKNKANVNAQNENGLTALMQAVSKGSVQITTLLLDNKADANAKNKNEKTALMLAVFTEHTQITEILLNHQADIINSVTTKGYTALIAASLNNHAAAVKTLLTLGANIDYLYCEKTALAHAIDEYQQSKEGVNVIGEFAIHAASNPQSENYLKIQEGLQSLDKDTKNKIKEYIVKNKEEISEDAINKFLSLAPSQQVEEGASVQVLVCLVLGAWCLVLGAWCLVLGAWCLVLGAWCLCNRIWTSNWLQKGA